MIIIKKTYFFLLFIHYPKTFLLSYQNQNHYNVFLHFLHLLRTRFSSRQGAAPGSKPRLAKQSATPALRAVLIKPELYHGVKVLKMLQQYLPENTLENKF